MIEAIAICVSVLVYGAHETTAFACRRHEPVTSESRQTMIQKTQAPREIVAVPAAVKPVPLTARPRNKVRAVRNQTRKRTHYVNRCGSQRSHWYWNKQQHRRRYRCR